MKNNKTVKIVIRLLLAINIVFLLTIILWPFINTTNHSSIEPYFFILPFIITAILAIILVFCAKEEKTGIIIIVISLIGIASLFSYKQFNIMLNYDEWLTRGTPSRFESVETMFWASNINVEENETNKSIVYPSGKIYLNPKLYFEHTVKKGETFSQIADRYNVSYLSIIWINNLEEGKVLYVNQKLLIPQHFGRVVILEEHMSIEETAKFYETDTWLLRNYNIKVIEESSNEIIKKGTELFIIVEPPKYVY